MKMNRLIAKAQAEMPGNFGRYKGESEHVVRTPETTATTISDLRTKRKMLRALDPETVKTMIEVRKDLNFFEAVEIAKKEGTLIVPNDIHDRILMETGDIDFLKQLYKGLIWTGTIIIYEEPNRKFKDKVVFEWKHNKVKYSISFTVPEQFRGKTNCALVAEHPHFEIQRISKDVVFGDSNTSMIVNAKHSRHRDRRSRDFELVNLGNNNYELKVIDERNIHLIERFPKVTYGWHEYNKFRIPVGEVVAYREDNTIRHLWRSSDKYIGPLVRYGGYYVRWQNVDAYCRHDSAFGVALF